MASSSSSSAARFSQVFLSFRGEDTRKTFTSHLYQALKIRGINTFQDDQRLELGDSISKELLKAIQESAVSVIIFSVSYATSRWCLDEVVEIMRCKDVYGQMVIPVFYDVDPTTVRHQTESFANAFKKHESRCTADEVKSWRASLNAAADLSGCDVRKGTESENVEKIVDRICSTLRTSTSLPYLRDVVGIGTHMEELNSLLKIEINDVRVVGIWGLGGIGKTTVARAIFDTLSDQFEAACFLAEVKENEKRNQLHSLQNVLLSELLRKKDDYVNDKYAGRNMISSRFCSKKVLIVLDDVDHRDHLEYLAGDVGWFGKGSRVIITTRDNRLIDKNHAIYEVRTLAGREAMQLFNQHAFKEEVPDEHFKELSLEVVNQAEGLPLALKVWGCLLHKRGLTQWRSAIDRIKENSRSEIDERLKISYDGLEPKVQQIFLDIACFFRGYEKEKVIPILESCGFGAHFGLDVLIERSLVFISGDGVIDMHDLIQDMGRYIVNKNKDPGERSRLWLKDDLEEVLINKTGTNTMEAIWIPWTSIELRHNFCNEAMENMKRLRILHLTTMRAMVDKMVIESLSNNLRWVVWKYYPWESLPANFEAKMLVHLKLDHSSLCVFQTGTKHFPSLRTLNLSWSHRLMQTPDFTGMPNLEYLYLEFCDSLEEVHDSLGNCNKLISLDLIGCVRLKRIPRVNVESLKYLILQRCSKLEKFPEIIGRMKLESEIGMTHSWIRELNLSGLDCLVALPSIICRSKNLVELDVSKCRKLESLPEEIGDSENLEMLDASFTRISRPPPSIVRLNKLEFLSFEKWRVENGVYFVFPPVAEGLLSLEYLNLSHCNLTDGGLPEDIGRLSSLKDLDLSGNNFEHLPPSIPQLGALRSLKLSCCERLKELPNLKGMQNLEALHLRSCNLIDGGLAEAIGCLSSLKTLDLSYCNIRDGELVKDIGCLSSLNKLFLKGNRFDHLPISIDQLGALQQLDLSDCERLTHLPELPLKLEVLCVDCDMALKSIANLATMTNLRQIICGNKINIQQVIPSWFLHQGEGGDESVSINLPENWFECHNFLGVAVYIPETLIYSEIELIPLCNDGMIQEVTLYDDLYEFHEDNCIHFLMVPVGGLRGICEANGKSPNDYAFIRLSFSYTTGFGYRMLYKDKLEPEALLPMRGNEKEEEGVTEHCIDGIPYDNEASWSTSKKQNSDCNISGRVARLFKNCASLSCKPKTLP